MSQGSELCRTTAQDNRFYPPRHAHARGVGASRHSHIVEGLPAGAAVHATKGTAHGGGVVGAVLVDSRVEYVGVIAAQSRLAAIE